MGRVVAGFIFALEALFAVGIAGSFLVLILTLIEDSRELFQKDKVPADSMAALPAAEIHQALPR
ncbi:MAG TPA: hypothetical protein VN868_01885 [Terriglobales bacterium]|jgi:hypothetical protein|nr:hypothetical protein [Terriglobales bacterium]